MRILKVLNSSAGFAVLFSFSYLAFYHFWGTSDVENAFKFDRAFAARYSGVQFGDMAAKDGVASLWGIPIFDATQGFGYRLPTQGSLGQSPFVFLRWFASVEVIQMVYLGLALYLCSWTIGKFCREQLVERSKFSSFVLHLTLLGPLILFTFVNEWQMTAAAYCSRAVLIIFVFYLARVQNSKVDGPLNLSVCSAAATAFFLIVVGHPGEWPLAFPSLMLILMLLVRRWKNRFSCARELSLQTFSSPPFVIVGCAVIVLLVNVADLFYEWTRPVSSSMRVVQRFGIEFNQLPTFAQFSKHQTLVETGVTLVMASVGPVVNLFVKTSGRYEFVALSMLTVIVGRFAFRRSDADKDTLNLVSIGLLLAAVIIFQYLGELFVIVPSFFQSSGAYLHAPQLLFVSVTLWCVNRQQIFRSTIDRFGVEFKERSGTVLGNVAVAIAFAGLLIQPISLLKLTSPQGISDYTSVIKQTESNLKANYRTADFLYIPDRVDSSYAWLAPGYVRAFEGFPVIENEPKVRNASTLITNPVFNQVVYSPDLGSAEFSLFRDFASIMNVLDVDSSKFDRNDLDAYQTSELIGSGSESKVAVASQGAFHSFLVEQKSLVEDESRCPLLENASCIQRISDYISSPQSIPRWKLGKREVLATYDWVNPIGAWGCLIPMDFDSALQVRDKKSGEVLSIYSHYGLLVVKLPEVESSGTFQIDVEPDWRMRARATASYLSLFCLVFASIKLVQKRKSRVLQN